jgi:hypothetical protein
MDDEDYEEKPLKEVGYRKPPKAHQFKPGQSGNLKGRPRKKKKVALPPGLAPLTADVILAEARRIVPVRDGAKVQDLDTLQALVRALNITGLKGNRRALVDAIKLARIAEEAAEKEWSALAESVLQYKLNWKEEFAHCRANRLPRPDPVPHPDDVVLDHVNRRIIYNGPQNAAEKAYWDRKLEHRDDLEWENDDFQSYARKEGRGVGHLWNTIELNKAIIKVIDGIYPDPKTRRAPGFNLQEWRRANGIQAQLAREGMRSFYPQRLREWLDTPQAA